MKHSPSRSPKERVEMRQGYAHSCGTKESLFINSLNVIWCVEIRYILFFFVYTFPKVILARVNKLCKISCTRFWLHDEQFITWRLSAFTFTVRPNLMGIKTINVHADGLSASTCVWLKLTRPRARSFVS